MQIKISSILKRGRTWKNFKKKRYMIHSKKYNNYLRDWSGDIFIHARTNNIRDLSSIFFFKKNTTKIFYIKYIMISTLFLTILYNSEEIKQLFFSRRLSHKNAFLTINVCFNYKKTTLLDCINKQAFTKNEFSFLAKIWIYIWQVKSREPNFLLHHN